MINLTNIGRIFYALSITEFGAQLIYDHDFPYIVPIQQPRCEPMIQGFAYLFGTILVLASLCIILKKMARLVSLLLGSMLLLLFCFYYIPYGLFSGQNYMRFEDWENAVKELALAGGALVIASCFTEQSKTRLSVFLQKLIPAGPVLFAVPMICFGLLHFIEAGAAAPLVPSWIPYHLFWMYFCGAALIGSGISIVLKVKTNLSAALLGLMIFIWFGILHLPRIIVSPAAGLGAEVTSAFLALAYAGTAFVIAGLVKDRVRRGV